MSVLNLPDLGEGLQDAEIVAWHVGEGDHVISDQPLVSVETDKAVVEIPAPVSGTITRLIAEVGEIVPVGSALAEISTERGEDTGAIVGDLGPAPDTRTAAALPEKQPVKSTGATVQAAPAVRSLARERMVNLAGIVGSGPGGVILSSDVLTAAGAWTGDELRGVRRAMAQAMTESHASVVAATVMDRAMIDRWPEDENPTLRLIHAIATACRAEPALNAWFDGNRRQLHDHVDLALAMDTPEGLFTPVLRNVGASKDLAAQLTGLKAAVRDRSIARADMKAATFTLSNFGMIGGEYAALVVTPPQVAILGAGRISVQMALVDNQPVPTRTLPLSLSFDHRVVTGGEAARFLNALKAGLERPGMDEQEGKS